MTKTEVQKPNYGVKVWFSTPDKIDAFKAEAGAFYELPLSECKDLTTYASNDTHARIKIEKMIEDTWGVPRGKFEIVEVRRLN